MKPLTLLFLAAVALAACKDDNKNSNRSVSEQDRSFAMDASMASEAEIQLSGTAADHSTNAAVKAFAQQMIGEHNTALNDLMTATKGTDIIITTDLDTAHQMMKQKLIGLNGYAFDTVFVNGMVNDHRKVIAMFEAENSIGQDDVLKSYAVTYLPHLKDHLTAAKALQTKLMTSDSTH